MVLRVHGSDTWSRLGVSRGSHTVHHSDGQSSNHMILGSYQRDIVVSFGQ